MKKILALLLISSIAFSCKKDDDSNSTNSLVGTWNLNEFTIKAYIENSPTPITNTEAIEGYKYEFLADKTVKVYENGQLVETSTYNTVERNGKIYLSGFDASEEMGFEINELEVVFDGDNKVSFNTVANNIALDLDGDPATPPLNIKKIEAAIKLTKQ